MDTMTTSKSDTKIKQQLRCSGCGAEVNAACDCGLPYVPASVAAAKAVAANPEKSDNAIAEEIGVDHKTVGEARKSVGGKSLTARRTGRDGKSYPATKSKTVERPLPPEPPDPSAPITAATEREYTKLIKQRLLYEGACTLLWQQYFEFRDAHPDCAPLTSDDLAYVSQWTTCAPNPLSLLLAEIERPLHDMEIAVECGNIEVDAVVASRTDALAIRFTAVADQMNLKINTAFTQH